MRLPGNAGIFELIFSLTNTENEAIILFDLALNSRLSTVMTASDWKLFSSSGCL
jgi:hypothetical protein